MISIIVPTLNEENFVLQTISKFQNLRKKNFCEIIVVDGKSSDNTIQIVQPYVDKILSISPSRSRQQNLGASVARGDLLLFLHADTTLTEEDLLKLKNYNKNYLWGFYLISLGENSFKYHVLEKCINFRSKIFKYATGDQGIFLEKGLFKIIGGFPNIDLMEDIRICEILKKFSPPYIIESKITTSSRKWKSNGFFRTVFKMRLLRFLYTIGLNTGFLRKHY